MARASSTSLTLPILAVLVLVGAGIVLLGPQLVGYVSFIGAPLVVSTYERIELYPHLVLNSSYVTNRDRVLTPSSDYAVLQHASIITGLKCPRYTIDRGNLCTVPSLLFQHNGWVMVGGGFHRPNLIENLSAHNITAIDLAIGDLDIGCTGSSCDFGQNTFGPIAGVGVYGWAKCLNGSTSNLLNSHPPMSAPWSQHMLVNFGTCYISDDSTNQLCSLSLISSSPYGGSGIFYYDPRLFDDPSTISSENAGTTSCYGWDIEYIILGRNTWSTDPGVRPDPVVRSVSLVKTVTVKTITRTNS